MPDAEAKADQQPAVRRDDDLESVARESGASEEQVAQLRRATESETELDDAAGAAARWS